MSKTTEEKLGDLFWDLFRKETSEIGSKNVKAPLDSLVEKICKANRIDVTTIKLHIVKSDQVNAFALPNRHLVIHSALILNVENEGELCGVISHEIAHMELSHVMKKLIKEVGLSVLISMTTGGSGETVRQAAKLLSSSAYDRSLEKEADLKAVDYLINAEMDPEQLANFLYRLADNESSSMKYLSWVTTHPDSKERAEYIIEAMEGKAKKNEPILKETTWNKLKEYLKGE
jgi:predicted Zn-dependent protease